jgi:hypothetical protein
MDVASVIDRLHLRDKALTVVRYCSGEAKVERRSRAMYIRRACISLVGMDSAHYRRRNPRRSECALLLSQALIRSVAGPSEKRAVIAPRAVCRGRGGGGKVPASFTHHPRRILQP